MSKSGTPQVSTTTSNNTPPPYVQAAQQNLLNTGANLAAPFTQDAPAFGVAGFNPDQTAAFDLARTSAQDAYTTPAFTATNTAGQWANPATSTPNNIMWAPDRVAAQAMFAGPSSAATAQQTGPAAQATAQNATAAQTDPNAYRPFLNPYTQDVVDTSNAELRRQHGITQADISAKMASGAAFGGSREGLRAAEGDRAFLDKSGSMTAQLMSQGYDKAVAQAMADTQLRQQAGLQNAQLGTNVSLDNARRSDAVGALNAQLGTSVGLNNAQRSDAINLANSQLGTNTNVNNATRQDQAWQFNANLGTNTLRDNATRADAIALDNARRQDTRDQFNSTAGQQATTLNNTFANDQQRRQMTALQALLGTGGQQQQTAQQSLNLPADWLQRLQQITPSTTGSLTQGQTSTPTQTNLLGAGVGLATALPGLIKGFGALGALSDENEKTDVKKLGKDPQTGIEMAAYRYKGDPKSYPKVVGPASAQQVERVRPGSTRKIGGKHVITTGALKKMMGS
jgi:hypothetical protein